LCHGFLSNAALPGTHWLAEQLPAETLAEIVPFLTA